jgi:hypothetical protein
VAVVRRERAVSVGKAQDDDLRFPARIDMSLDWGAFPKQENIAKNATDRTPETSPHAGESEKPDHPRRKLWAQY